MTEQEKRDNLKLMTPADHLAWLMDPGQEDLRAGIQSRYSSTLEYREAATASIENFRNLVDQQADIDSKGITSFDIRSMDLVGYTGQEANGRSPAFTRVAGVNNVTGRWYEWQLDPEFSEVVDYSKFHNAIGPVTEMQQLADKSSSFGEDL